MERDEEEWVVEFFEGACDPDRGQGVNVELRHLSARLRIAGRVRVQPDRGHWVEDLEDNDALQPAAAREVLLRVYRHFANTFWSAGGGGMGAAVTLRDLFAGDREEYQQIEARIRAGICIFRSEEDARLSEEVAAGRPTPERIERMDRYEEDDERVPESLRPVEVLRCSPAFADTPEIGPPAAIVTLGHAGEVEEPLLLTLPEVRRLALGLLRVLAYHEPGAAPVLEHLHALTDRLVVTMGNEHGMGMSPHLVERDQLRKAESSRDEERLTLAVNFRNRSLSPMLVSIVGGYRSKGETMMLGMSDRFGKPVGTWARILRDGYVRFRGHGSRALPKDEWPSFSSSPAGAKITLGRRVWVKLSPAEIKACIEDRVLSLHPSESRRPSPSKRRAKERWCDEQVSKSQPSGRTRRNSGRK